MDCIIFLVGLKDYYIQTEQAEKELKSLVPKIIESIKSELLIAHPTSKKPSIEISENMKDALDNCSDNFNWMFEYEKRQRATATLNDWTLSDVAIASVFTDVTDSNR